MSRTLAREDAFKLIFEMEITKISAEDALGYLFDTVEKSNEMWAQNSVSSACQKYIETVVRGVEEKRSLLNEMIEQHLKDWTIQRISKVNLAILQLAAFEIAFIDDIPQKVSVNEAVELAKKYSGKEDSSFINGVLGALINSDKKGEGN